MDYVNRLLGDFPDAAAQDGRGDVGIAPYDVPLGNVSSVTPTPPVAPEHRPRLWRKRAVWRRLAKRSNANGSEQCDY